MTEKELTLKQIEEALEKIGIPEYPKYLGGGLWKLAENCIANQKGYEEFIEKLKDEDWHI